MKLVYADDLLYYVDALLDRNHAPAIGGLALHKIVDRMKGIDAVPVVRCKDCRYFHRFTDWADCDFHEWYRAEPNENDFCSRGEMKDNV